VIAFAAYRYSSDYQTNPLVPIAKVTNFATWDLSIDYDWRDWRFRLFSKNVTDKRYLQHVETHNSAQYTTVDQTTGVATLFTNAEYNQPRYTGIEITYTPEL
jgi:hypothetical protein